MRLKLFLSLLLIISLHSVSAQNEPKLIKSKGEYLHSASNVAFPEKIDKYDRTGIFAFDKKKNNIGVTYEYKGEEEKIKITVYVYPAHDGVDDRLRSEFMVSMQSVADVTESGIDAQLYPVHYANSGYKINGFKGDIQNTYERSTLSVFECGRWFFKIRITSDNPDSAHAATIEQKMIDYFTPTKLVIDHPLNPKADISFAKAAFRDSLMLGCAMNSAFSEVRWAKEHVDSLERASGFPGLYLGLHEATLKGFVEYQKNHPNQSTSEKTTEFLAQLNAIIDSGFLKEFIMEQNHMIMIVPDGQRLDFIAYEKWKADHPIDLELKYRYYLVWYKQ